MFSEFHMASTTEEKWTLRCMCVFLLLHFNIHVEKERHKGSLSLIQMRSADLLEGLHIKRTD